VGAVMAIPLKGPVLPSRRALWRVDHRRENPDAASVVARGWFLWKRGEAVMGVRNTVETLSGTRGGLRAWIVVLVALPGCHAFPVTGKVDTDARVTAGFQGKIDAGFKGTVDVRVPPAPDPGPVVPMIVRRSPTGPNAPRIAILDIDGLLLNQNLTGLYSVGENPVASFREKLEAAACDPRVRAVVLRVNSPGGGVAASDLMAEELRRFRAATGKPTVACLLDLATGGALYLAIGCDRVVALPTTVTGAVGAVVNHANLEDAMAALNVRVETIKAGPLVDMGSVIAPMSDDVRKMFQEMADGFRDRFLGRVASSRRLMTEADCKLVADGRILSAPKALKAHLVDALGYPDDAIVEAERLGGVTGAEVVIFQREGYPTRSIYATTPNTPLQSEMIPLSYPGLERSKLPTFLYLWQPDPTIIRQGGH
jgi:protease IV